MGTEPQLSPWQPRRGQTRLGVPPVSLCSARAEVRASRSPQTPGSLWAVAGVGDASPSHRLGPWDGGAGREIERFFSQSFQPLVLSL